MAGAHAFRTSCHPRNPPVYCTTRVEVPSPIHWCTFHSGTHTHSRCWNLQSASLFLQRVYVCIGHSLLQSPLPLATRDAAHASTPPALYTATQAALRTRFVPRKKKKVPRGILTPQRIPTLRVLSTTIRNPKGWILEKLSNRRFYGIFRKVSFVATWSTVVAVPSTPHMPPSKKSEHAACACTPSRAFFFPPLSDSID